MILLATSGVAFVFAGTWTLHRFVLSRLFAINEQLHTLGPDAATNRIALDTEDEWAALRDSLNGMLDQIGHTQDGMQALISDQVALLEIENSVQQMNHADDLEHVVKAVEEQLRSRNLDYESLTIRRLVKEESMEFETHTIREPHGYRKVRRSSQSVYSGWKAQTILCRRDIRLPEHQAGLPDGYLDKEPDLRSLLVIPFSNGMIVLRS